MTVLEKLINIWDGVEYPFLIHTKKKLNFNDISSQNPIDLSEINQGDVVALIGDFDPDSILTLLRLIDLGAVIVPLTKDTAEQHEYFFESALVDFIIKDLRVIKRSHKAENMILEELRDKKRPGLVLFSTGTTGRPKAILHDLTHFLKRFETPRPTLKTINFLLFDHIGGLNTLLHTLFNKGTVVAPKDRTIDSILETCAKNDVEVLPTTPTFLRMMLLSGLVPHAIPDSLKIITYGTERMDKITLNKLCKLLPNIDFRQTFGMSELGILRVKSKSRDSLYMKVGGEGVETKVVDGILYIRSSTKMMGYLNAESPFDKDGWYNTNDVVDEKDGYYKVTGRIGDVINVAGLKFMASEVELVAMAYENVLNVKVISKDNPLTGQHVEIEVQPSNDKFNLQGFKNYLNKSLQSHMVPKRIKIKQINIGHRFKKL